MLELYLLVRVGSVLGALNTVLLVIVTGALGAALARREWRSVSGQWQQALQTGKAPEDGVLSGILVFAGGLLLITPGIFTDVFGLLMLIPWSRRAAARLLKRAFEQQVAAGNVQFSTFGMGGQPGGRSPFDGPSVGGPGPFGGPGGGGQVRAPGARRDPFGPGPGTGGVIDTDGEDVSDR